MTCSLYYINKGSVHCLQVGSEFITCSTQNVGLFSVWQGCGLDPLPGSVAFRDSEIIVKQIHLLNPLINTQRVINKGFKNWESSQATTFKH